MEATEGGQDENESGTEKNEAIELPEDIQHPNDPAISEDDNSSDSTDGLAISNDDLVVQVLARLDGQAYYQALYKDAGTIAQNFLAPNNFPWNSRARLPQKITRTMPRDIDDLHAITHCQDELHAPFGDFQGPFGFGRYENGQSRGNYSNKPSPNSDAPAAARRSQDPGVLELNVQVPLPTSIDSLMDIEDPEAPSPAQQWRNELLNDPDHVEMLSHLPYHWQKKDGYPPSHDQQLNHSICVKQGDLELKKLAESRLKSKAEIDLASSCRRNWKISMKVGGVSSRSTLFPPSVSDTKGDQDMPENSRKVIRPMLCLASLPQSIQVGKSVSSEKVMEMDKVGFAHSLGSYDCRFTDALLNPKRDSIIRAKKAEVGRTRLVWSNLIQGDDTTSRNRGVSFNSLLTGQRFEVSKCKRPTEVKVGVRLNGRIILEEALEDLPASNVRKRKHSTRQAENDFPALKSRIHCPEFRTDEEIDAALRNNFIGLPEEEDRVIERSTENGAVVYLEMGVESSTYSDIDRNDIIASLMKFNQKKSAQKKLKKSASSGAMSTESNPMPFGGSQVIKKSNSPRFALVPLEDGLIRTVCLAAGNMPGVAVHQVIREVLEQESGRRCSVCWSDEGTGKEGVLECRTCGLRAHSNCCLDRGELCSPSNVHKGPEGQSTGPQDVKQRLNSNGAAKDQNAEIQGMQHSDGQAEQWQCAVCCRYTGMKPHRNPRMPSRFVDGETYTSSNHPGDQDVISRNANTPGPGCTLCIHRGGAMSPFHSGYGSQRWAHDVCRVWSGQDLSDGPNMDNCSSGLPFASPLSQFCALCGTGGVKGQLNVGLTRCAARGCSVAFHPMCALLASKVGFDEKGSKSSNRKKRKTRHTDQLAEEKRSDDQENIEADKKLCKEYTLQLVQLRGGDNAGDSEDEQMTIIPVAFCGIHNPQRDDSFFGCLPGGAAF